MRHRGTQALIVMASAGVAAAQQLVFVDATAPVGLAGINATRMCLADVDGDGRPDAVVRAMETGKADRYRVFLNRVKESGAGGGTGGGVEFKELEDTGLPGPIGGDCLVFADIDNDGHADAVFTRSLDVNNEKFVEPPEPKRTCWMKGNGDGTFGTAQVIEAAQRATTACVAVGDVDRDGLLDLYLGNWYTKYGVSNEAFNNDTLLQDRSMDTSSGDWAEVGARPFVRLHCSNDDRAFDDSSDGAGRPTYGAVIACLTSRSTELDRTPEVLELNYGRRANRTWKPQYVLLNAFGGVDTQSPKWHQQCFAFALEEAESFGLDGDDNRSGRYPEWLKERAKTDPRFARDDEKPYRSHGNTFDASVNDIDSDGDFDLFLAEITHGWAGESSDRSRFLVNTDGTFAYDPRLCVDRVPGDPTVRNWNQGDLFCQLEDFDHDGRVDLLLASSDYPDNQRTRVFRQQEDGTFKDITAWCGINNEGSGQPSVGDIDLDGDLDIIVGQSFNRLDATQIAGRSPTMKVYLNQMVERRAERVKNQLEVRGAVANALVLKLVGDPAEGCSRDALGAIVRVTADVDGDPATPAVTQSRQLIGIGGHAGKQMEFVVHVGLGAATLADRVEVVWPDRHGSVTVLEGVEAGRRVVKQGREE